MAGQGAVDAPHGVITADLFLRGTHLGPLARPCASKAHGRSCYIFFREKKT